MLGLFLNQVEAAGQKAPEGKAPEEDEARVSGRSVFRDVRDSQGAWAKQSCDIRLFKSQAHAIEPTIPDPS